MSVKISVVVPVFNPGQHIDPLIKCLRRQSMPATDFEAIFVDDGSTDDTPEKLDRLAEAEPNVKVIHIPNSGWPGRPRNIGIEAAAGEYVQFVDHDDVLGDEALERLYAYAKENDSDVVVGKEVRRPGRAPLRPIFHQNRPRATLGKDPILGILTPHKMFRREFLDEHRIRFFEGPRRLEDHPFVVEAYFKAKVISVLSDYPVYYWTRHPDRRNAGAMPRDWPLWYGYLRDVLDVVEQNTEPGDFRDRLLSFWYQSKGLNLLVGLLPNMTAEDGRYLFDSLRELTEERYPTSVDRFLPASMRLRSQLLRAGDFDATLRLAQVEKGFAVLQTLSGIETTDRGITVRVRAGLGYADGSPVVLESNGNRKVWRPPVEHSGRLDEHAPDLTDQYQQTHVELLLRDRATRSSLLVGGTRTPVPGSPDEVPLLFDASFEIDPEHVAHGDRLARGLYDLHIRVRSAGWTAQAPLESPAGARPKAPLSAVLSTDRTVVPFATRSGKVSLDVGHRTVHLLADARPDLTTTTLRRDGQTLVLRVPVDGLGLRGRRLRGRLRLVPETGGKPFAFRAHLVPSSGHGPPQIVSRITLGPTAPGGTGRRELQAVFGRHRADLGLVLQTGPNNGFILTGTSGETVARGTTDDLNRVLASAHRVPGAAPTARLVRRVTSRLRRK